MTTAVRTIDLRSDTVTLPSPLMRQAMANADMGDDLLGDDPTTRRLEAMAAERMGKEAAIFVASGTMGNLVSLLTHTTGRGEEVIADTWRTSSSPRSAAAPASRHPDTHRPQRRARTPRPRRDPVVDPQGVCRPRRLRKLICLENTHNFCNGAALPASYIGEVAAVARENGLALHIDGARIFNAAIALETTPPSSYREAAPSPSASRRGSPAPSAR